MEKKKAGTPRAQGQALERWRLTYVVEQQDRAFRGLRSIAASLQRGDYGSIGPQLASVVDAMAAQAELISAMALVLGVLDPKELEKALEAAKLGVESIDGSHN